MNALLPLRPAFIARLDTARELGWRFFRGADAAGAPGAPPEEFEGHRPYSPGDDVRWVDWNIFARQQELYVKVFRADEEVEVLLLVDASASMTGDGGLKHRTAAAAGVALARLALLTGHPVRTARYAERLLDVRGPWRSPDDIAAVQAHLAAPAPPAGTGTNLAEALAPLLTGRQRPASVVALTDGFQESPLAGAVTAALVRGARRVSLVRIVEPGDLAPDLRGLTVLLDPESGQRRELIADRALREQARRRIADHFQLLREAMARIGAPLHELALRSPFEEAILSLLRGPAPAPRAT
jgi:uncharacterized protein (DUF58 family)